MKNRIGNDGFSLNPHNIEPEIWCYEEPNGLWVTCKGYEFIIPWQTIEAYVRRRNKRKQK